MLTWASSSAVGRIRRFYRSGMDEYRTEAKGRPIDYRSVRHGQILTWGFVTAPLQHFHPQNQMARRFRYFGR